jgi:HlyD family secretion protein
MRLLLLCCALASAAACSERPPENVLRASGHVEATEVRLAPDAGGRILELAVEEGTRIAAGDLVLRIDARDAELALQRARAELRAAEAQVRLLEAGSRVEDVRQADAQLAAARAESASVRRELEAAERDLGRFESLLQRNAGSQKQRDDAATRRDVARERVELAAQRERAAEAVLKRLQTGSRREEVEAARARAAAVAAQVATLEKALADTTLTSPVGGMVTEKLVERGEIVAPRTPVAVVTDLDHAWADVFVPEPAVPRIQIGQPARLFTDAPGSAIPGRVSWISPKAEFTPRNVQTAEERSRLVYRVRIRADNRSGILKPGMPVDAELELRSAQP